MLVQLVCLDRRYQRMNCYNIREIQTILKSKYAPASSDSADVHFNLNDTAIGLRYQIGGLDFIDPAMFTYYRNALATHPRYRAIHEFLHKPIVEFDSVKLFMSKSSLMFSVLKTMYSDETLDVRHLFGSSSLTGSGSTSSLLTNLIPTSTTSHFSVAANTFSLGDARFVLYSLHPGLFFDKLVSSSISITSFVIQPLCFTLGSMARG